MTLAEDLGVSPQAIRLRGESMLLPEVVTSAVRHFRVSVFGFRLLARGVHADTQRPVSTDAALPRQRAELLAIEPRQASEPAKVLSKLAGLWLWAVPSE